MSDLMVPESPRQKAILRDIRNILAKYLVKGDAKDLDTVALQIWKVTRTVRPLDSKGSTDE